MAFHQEISVPVKGQYYLRTAIHDMVSDNVGAVEIPVAAVARLDPLTASVGGGACRCTGCDRHPRQPRPRLRQTGPAPAGRRCATP